MLAGPPAAPGRMGKPLIGGGTLPLPLEDDGRDEPFEEDGRAGPLEEDGREVLAPEADIFVDRQKTDSGLI